VIRATLDVNVLASGLLAETGTPAELIDFWTNLAFELVVSELILEGLERTWRRRYYQRRFDAERARGALASLRAQATLVAPVKTLQGVAADEADDLVLAAAIAGSVRYLEILFDSAADEGYAKRSR
jgi:putative PIN family toxin of toxin-antitoxin system